MTAKPDFDLDEYLRTCSATYAYFNQGEWWKPNQRPMVDIADMEPAWRLNCLRWLERRADSFEHRYTFGEASFQSQTFQDETGRTFSGFDMMSDLGRDAFEQQQHERHADPVAWIQTTALYRALAEGLPAEGAEDAESAEAQELRYKAQHYSTCPCRADLSARCTCHRSECAIRDGHPEVGCTCQDFFPESS